MEKTDDDGIWMFPLVKSILIVFVNDTETLMSAAAVDDNNKHALRVGYDYCCCVKKIIWFKVLKQTNITTYFDCLLLLYIVLCCFLKLAVEIVFTFSKST